MTSRRDASLPHHFPRLFPAPFVPRGPGATDGPSGSRGRLRRGPGGGGKARPPPEPSGAWWGGGAGGPRRGGDDAPGSIAAFSGGPPQFGGWERRVRRGFDAVLALLEPLPVSPVPQVRKMLPRAPARRSPVRYPVIPPSSPFPVHFLPSLGSFFSFPAVNPAAPPGTAPSLGTSLELQRPASPPLLPGNRERSSPPCPPSRQGLGGTGGVPGSAPRLGHSLAGGAEGFLEHSWGGMCVFYPCPPTFQHQTPSHLPPSALLSSPG